MTLSCLLLPVLHLFTFPLTQKRMTKLSNHQRQVHLEAKKSKETDPVSKSSTETGFATKHDRFQPHPLFK
jgi:hypothetical protein